MGIYIVNIGQVGGGYRVKYSDLNFGILLKKIYVA